MSHLLELLGRGLQSDIADLLDRHFRAPTIRSIEQLQASCRQHPDWPDVHFQLGLAYLRAAQVPEAIEHLSQACRQKPDYLAARLALAAAHEENSDPVAALDQLKIANQTHPGETNVLFAIGFCHEKLLQPKAAAEAYRDVVESDPSFRPARERLAAVAVFLDDIDAAIEQYRALQLAEPHLAWIHSALAHLYHRAGHYDQAVEEFQAAIAMEPENWALLDDQVESLIASGQIRQAIDRLHELLERQGPFADLYVRLADLYSQTGDDDAATKHYLQGLEIQPDYIEALVKLGTHHLVFARWDQAAEAFHQAADLNDRVLTNYVGMGVAQAAAGNQVEALNSFDLAAAVEPNSTLLLAEMARLQLKAAVADEFTRSFQDDQSPAVDDIRLDHDDLLGKQTAVHAEQVRLHPRHADLRYRYGVLLRAEGRLGEAMEQYAEAVDINPTYVQAIIKLALTQQELGQGAEAVQTFQKALEVRPEYVDLHYRLGLLYTDRRQFEEAVRHMEEASDGAPDNEQIRASLALALQNMGLMDRAAATWRSLWKIHHAKA